MQKMSPDEKVNWIDYDVSVEERLLQNAYAASQDLAVEEDLKEGLQEILSEILGDKNKTEAAVQMYRYYFDRKIPFGRELIENSEDVSQGRISTAVYFARAVWLSQENVYKLPPDSLDFVEQLLDLLRDNKAKHGHYAMVEVSRFVGYAHTFPYIFRLGRLEFEIARFAYPYTVYAENGRIFELVQQTVTEENGTITGNLYAEDGLNLAEPVTLANPVCLLKQGDMVLSVHVPGKEKMSDELVESAFQQALPFFKRYFPEMKFKAYICSSWLLDPDLSRFLNKESNILRFQRRFCIPFKQCYNPALYTFIFNRPKVCPLEELVPQNRFQREILEYVKAGGDIYSGRGYILI